MSNKSVDINQLSCQRLKSWMRENKIFQEDLAQGVDYTPQYLSSVINGKKKLTYELASRIEKWSRQEPATKDDFFSKGYWLKPERYKDARPISRFWLLGGEDDELSKQIDEQTKCVEALKMENEALKNKLREISIICSLSSRFFTEKGVR